jgi:hypothetical protein
MADNNLVGKLGSQIKSQISGFASGMKGAFVSSNPALLAPAIGGIEKALKNQTSALRREQEQRRAEKGFAEENANEQRKLFSDILGQQKESNNYLEKILKALLGKDKEEGALWKNLLAPLLALGKYLKDGFGKLLKALNGLFDLLKAFKLGDLLKGLQLRLSGLLDDIIKFFKGIPGKLGLFLDDIIKFFKGIPGKLGLFLDDIIKFFKSIPGKLGSFVDDIIKFFKDIPGKLGSFVDDIIKFFKDIPGKLGSFVDDIIKFFKDIPGKLGGWLDEVARLLSAFPAKLSGWIGDLFKTLGALLPETSNALRKLFSDLADILKLENLKLLFDNAIKDLGNAFTDFIKLIKESDLFKAFGSLIDDLKAIPVEIATKIRGAIKAIQESDIVKYIDQLFDTMKLTFSRVPGAVVSSIGALAEAIKGSDFIKSISQLGDVVEGKFTSLGQALDARFTAISDAIKASPITKAAGTIADDLAEIGRAFVADIRAKVPTPSAPDAPGAGATPAGATPEKPGFLMSAEDKIRARPQYVPPEVPGAGVLDETGTLAKIKNLIPKGMMNFIDEMGEAMAKVFLFVKNVGVSIGEGAKGLGRFLSAITDLDVMLKMIGKFMKALPVIGWIFTTIDGLQAAFDTSTIAQTLGKQVEDVTFGDRIKAFIGGFFGSFGAIVDFVAGLMGEETTVQKDMTAAITKLTDEIATQMMDLFRFFGGLLTSEPMMAIYKFVGSFAKIAFETIGGSLKSVIELMVGILTFNPNKMMGGIKGLYDSFMRGFTQTFALIGNLLKAPISRLINIVISSFETSINFFVDGMNVLIGKLKNFTVFGQRIGKVFDDVTGFERITFSKMDEGTPTSTAPPTAAPPPPAPPTAPSTSSSSRPVAPVNTRPNAPRSMSPVAGSSVPGEAVAGDPLSVRNFNPGNIRYDSRFTGPGGVLEGAVPGERGFARFSTPEAGMEAMYRQLYLDTQTRGMTLGRFVSKYAPESENNTKGYISFIGSRTGLRPDDKIPLELLPEVMKAMVQMEGGKAASQFYYDGGARQGGQGNPGRARSFFMGTGGGGPNEDYANWSDIRQPTGEPDKPVTVSPDDKWSEAIDRADAEMGAAMTENLRIAQEEAIRKKEADEKAHALQQERIDQAQKIADDENERYKRERLELYRQFNQTAKNIYENTLKASLGNLGVTGSQAFVMGGSAIIDKYLGASFKSLGEKLFGKQQGGGMGMIFQKLLGSYTSQAVNQVIAPALGIPSDLMNRALNNFAQGNKKEAYADIVFGMTGVATDARTFLESITGKRGVDTAIAQFSQTLADISTGPLADLFTMAPNGMGMYKVDPMMDPTVAGPAMGANILLEGSKAAGRVQFEAAKASASILVTGAQTSAKIDEESAKNTADTLRYGAGQGQQNFFGTVFGAVKEAFGFGGQPSGTMPRGNWTAADMDDWYANPANASRLPPWLGQGKAGGGSAFDNLMGMTGNFLGFAGGQALGRSLGVRQDTLGGMLAQAGINSVTGSLSNTLFTQGGAAAYSQLGQIGSNLYSMLQGGVGAGMGNLGSQALAKMGYGVGSMGGQFFAGMSQSGSFGTTLYNQLAHGGVGTDLAGNVINTGFEGMSASNVAGQAIGAAGTAFATYQLAKALSGGYSAGKAVNYIAAALSFTPLGMFAAPIAAVVNRLFGRKAPSARGGGIVGTVGGEQGASLQSYTDMFQKGGTYRSDKSWTEYGAVDKEFLESVQGIVKDTAKTYGTLSKTLDLSATESQFQAYQKDIKLQTSGKTEEQIKKELADVMNQYAEDMLRSVYPILDEYRQKIDGVMETNVQAFERLASASVNATGAIKMLGFDSTLFSDMIVKNGKNIVNYTEDVFETVTRSYGGYDYEYGYSSYDVTTTEKVGTINRQRQMTADEIKLAAAAEASRFSQAYGGDEKMKQTIQNYLGQAYTSKEQQKVVSDMTKARIADVIKTDSGLQSLMDYTKYTDVESARLAHRAAVDEAIKSGNYTRSALLMENYGAFIEAVRMNIREKSVAAAESTTAPGAFVDQSILRPEDMVAIDNDQSIIRQVEAATPIIAATTGQFTEGEANINVPVIQPTSGTTNAFLNEMYGGRQEPSLSQTNNNTVVDNSTVVASRPTAITVMRDDNVRDYHPILGSSNRGLSGGYGWGNDYQGSFGGG